MDEDLAKELEQERELYGFGMPGRRPRETADAFGRALGRARRRLGLSQRDVAARTRIGRHCLIRYELGTRRPRVDDFARLCMLYELPPEKRLELLALLCSS